MPFLKQVTPLWEKSPLPLKELAALCNISESSASRYLNGKVSPPADVAERILEVLVAHAASPAAPEETPPPVAPSASQICEVYKDQIATLQATHASHISTLQADHAAHIAALQANYASQISDLKRDKALLFYTLLGMFFVLVYFIFDGLHGDWGLIRYI